MNVFILIVVNVIVPVFTLIGAGIFLQRKFKLDMNTLSKLNAFFLMPAVSFLNIYDSKIGGMLLYILGFLLLQSSALIAFSTVASKLAKLDKSTSSTFKNSVVLINSGNFGLPVSQLVFPNNPLGASVQVVVMIYQNLLTNTYGLINAVAGGSSGLKEAVRELLKNPVFYAFLAGLLLNLLKVPMPAFLRNPIENTSNAFLAIALLTLGAQSAYLKIRAVSAPLLLSLAGRLIVSPVLAYAVITVMGLEGTVAQALFIASSFPTSRNSAIFALEYGNQPEYAAQAVLLSTLLSSATVAAVVYLSNILF
ncbi:AEC family transporter [Paenibacillus thalictri]|uniref:AEC family transporter n=1 Tax=Paenibacillus thalictri TaxID=2527873 RepID=A0A4Q9DXI0_9BACL|nr:AEC family transporter [Paenibacillus thalictri]TBL79941.1 AEC family transporter [Paenibacillus thalictri]